LEVEFEKIHSYKPWRKDNVRIIKPKHHRDAQWHIEIRSAAIHDVTVRDHLLLVHLTYANYLTQAVNVLPKGDPLRNLLLRHVEGSIEKNSDGYWLLFREHGLIEGAAGINWEEVRQQMMKARDAWIKDPVKTFEDWKKHNPVFSSTKYVQRGDHVHKCIKEYVSEYFNYYGIRDYSKYKDFWNVMKEMIGNPHLDISNLQTWIVECLWRVTYFHYQVGSVLPYLYDSSMIRWKPGNLPNKGVGWSLVIAFATSERQYQLINAAYCKDKLWHKFVTRLIQDRPRDPTDVLVGDTGFPDWLWELELSVAR